MQKQQRNWIILRRNGKIHRSKWYTRLPVVHRPFFNVVVGFKPFHISFVAVACEIYVCSAAKSNKHNEIRQYIQSIFFHWCIYSSVSIQIRWFFSTSVPKMTTTQSNCTANLWKQRNKSENGRAQQREKLKSKISKHKNRFASNILKYSKQLHMGLVYVLQQLNIGKSIHLLRINQQQHSLLSTFFV